MTLTVHHLQVSQSERIVWLCEELGIDYTLQLHQRAPFLSPQSIKDLNPLGQAPVIQDSDGNGEIIVTLAESAACCDYINYRHGGGRLALPPDHKHYADYLYWFHFANSTLQPSFGRLFTLQTAKVPSDSDAYQRQSSQLDKYLSLLDARLAQNSWLAGDDQLTAADCMTVTTLTTMRTFLPFDLSKYSNILAYLQRVAQRDAYQRARAKADPNLALMIDGPPPEQYIDQIRAEGKI